MVDMARCLAITKLLVLKILLYSSICAVGGYDYGYHPSAEEFDSFMRDPGRTWTRDLLANERRRSWTRGLAPARDYVPKYNYEHRHEQHTSHNRPGYVEPIHRPTDDRRHDQVGAATVLSGSNIGSTLDFTMFNGDNSDEITSAQGNEMHRQEATPQPVHLAGPAHVQHPNVFNIQESGPVNVSILQMPGVGVDSGTSYSELALSVDNYKPQVSGENNTDVSFPIFFTNPATGIVYAITEVGKTPNNTALANDRIPIYITKEQHDRDLFLLRKYYEGKCRRPNVRNSTGTQDSRPVVPDTVLSHSLNTTLRPQIIRLQKPSANHNSKVPVSKLPSTHLGKPPPVMVQTGLTVSNQVNLPAVKRKKKKQKKKNKKINKRPGKKPDTVKRVTQRPLTATVTPTSVTAKRPSTTFPYIVKGTHATTMKPSPRPYGLSTQLEKPNVPATIFSERPLVATSGYMTPHSKIHRIKKRATDWENAKEQNKSLIPDRDIRANRRQRKRKSSRKSGKPAHPRNKTRVKILGLRRKNHTNTVAVGNISTTNHTMLDTASNSSTAASVDQSTQRSSQKSPANAKHSRKSTKRKRNKSTKNEGGEQKDSSFDWLDFVDEEDDDDDEIYDDEDDDDDDDEDDYYFDKEVEVQPPTAPESASTDKDLDDGLKEDLGPDNASSAEEGADFGAMDDAIITEEPPARPDEESSEESVSSTTKNAMGKKRIRRRPSKDSTSASSNEDYDDDDEDDGGDVGGGIGGFFRMIFYPVQMLMNGMFDSFTDNQSGEQPSSPGYPVYTQYNNAVNDDVEDEKANAFTGWFSSLFGFNRRTKKISSTTVAPLNPSIPPPPSPTEETGWFDSWFGYGKSTTPATSYEYYDDADDGDDKWFFGWFDTKPKKQQRRRTTTTTPTAPVHQVPILTIVDPLKNPQNWIGILAHHIINATTTHNPLAQVVNRATTVDPDIPRKLSYDKYQIWRLKPQDDADVKALEEFKKSEDGIKLQWLKGPSLRGLTDVLVPPKMFTDIQGALNFETIAHEVLIFDVGKAISYEQSKEQYHYTVTQNPKTKKGNPKSAPFAMSWNKYHEFDDIIKYLEAIRMRQPQIIELIHIGRSYEGRPLVVVKVESKEKAAATTAAAQAGHSKLRQKKTTNQGNAVFIESGTHGSEWIGPATTTWMISELLRIMKNNKTTVDNDFIRNTTWYFMPVLNPDGYVYSHGYDRFWRKSRSRHVHRPGDFISSAITWLQQKRPTTRVCYGVDLDRNWQYQWGRRGSSMAPCNEFYAGPVQFSEPETKALSDFLMDNRKEIKLYISMQAYGQILSYPSKVNASFHSEQLDDLLDVATVGMDGLRKKGSKTRYKIDTANDLLESRSGCSDAYAAYEVGIPFSYTMQLADNGVHGYLLPSSSIEPTAKDAFEIVTAMLDYI